MSATVPAAAGRGADPRGPVPSWACRTFCYFRRSPRLKSSCQTGLSRTLAPNFWRPGSLSLPTYGHPKVGARLGILDGVKVSRSQPAGEFSHPWLTALTVAGGEKRQENSFLLPLALEPLKNRGKKAGGIEKGLTAGMPLAGDGRLERPTFGSGDQRSIHLS